MKAEALLNDASKFLEFWEEMRDLAGKAIETDEPIESEDEQRFLEVKSTLSKLQRSLAEATPPDLTFNGKKVGDMLKNTAISLQHLRNMPKGDQDAFRGDAHGIWLQLIRMEGGLEFLSAGWKPEKPKKKKSKKKGKRNKKIVIIAIILAGVGAAWYMKLLPF